MKLVLDASVVVKWLLPDPEPEAHVETSLRLLAAIKAGTVTPIQPPHWLAEVAAVITRLQPETARRAVELLHKMEIPVTGGLEVFTRAVALAAELHHHVFDTLYHAVALEHDATLITADERYYHKAHRLGSLRELGDLTAGLMDRPSDA